MSRIVEKDLHTLDSECRWNDIEEIKGQWDYDIDNGAFDEEVRSEILWKIFTEKNPKWLNHLTRQIQSAKKYRQLNEVIYFAIYWTRYQEDLMQIYNDTQHCLDLIEQQKDELESEIEDAKNAMEKASNEYDDLANKIESITGDNGVPDIRMVSRYSKVENSWKVDMSGLEDTEYDEYEISAMIDDMEGWKDDYHDQEEIVDDYEELVELAKQNYEKAEEFQGDVMDWMYDY